MNMQCEVCPDTMSYLYDVTERDTQFVHWECACGHRYLERRPGKEHSGGAPTFAALASLAGAGVEEFAK